MANKAKKSEHAGHKGSRRKGGYHGLRQDAKDESKKARREQDKEEVSDETR